MRCHQSFWGPEVGHFEPLDGPLNIDLEVPFFRFKLGRISTLTTLSFTWIQADFDLQIYFQKFCFTNHCALAAGAAMEIARHTCTMPHSTAY